MIISRVLRSDGGKSLTVPEAIAIDSWWFLAEVLASRLKPHRV